MERGGFPLAFVAGRVVLTLLAGIFLWFGIDLLIAAYGLGSPLEFIAVFFASNLIILISAVLALGFVLAIVRRLRQRPEPLEAESGPGTPGADEEPGKELFEDESGDEL